MLRKEGSTTPRITSLHSIFIVSFKLIKHQRQWSGNPMPHPKLNLHHTFSHIDIHDSVIGHLCSLSESKCVSSLSCRVEKMKFSQNLFKLHGAI